MRAKTGGVFLVGWNRRTKTTKRMYAVGNFTLQAVDTPGLELKNALTELLRIGTREPIVQEVGAL